MKLKLNVPQSLADITLAEYKHYEKIVNTNADTENSERFINLKMLEIFCGITFEQAKAIQLNDYNELIVHLYEVLQEQPKLVQRFKMGEVEFGFVPNLEEMTFGEYIDLDTYIHNMQEIEKAMAVLYRPIKTSHKSKYTIHEYQGDLMHDEMLKMPMDAVVSSVVFFYRLGIELSNAMMNCSEGLAVQQAQLEDLRKNGVGINPYTHSLRAILDDLKILPN